MTILKDESVTEFAAHMAVYYLSLSILIAHELDAVAHSEWRLLFVLRDLDETVAAQVFVGAHVPLMFLVLWFSHHANPKVSGRTKIGVSAFLILHALMHFALSGAPEYDFNGMLSRGLLAFSGIFAGLFLADLWRKRDAA